MRIAILSRKASLYSTRRLKEAGLERGHDVRVIDYLRCYMDITSHRPKIYFKGELLESFDAVVPRIGASYTFYGTAVVRQFEMMKVLPVTSFAHSTKDVQGLIQTVKGAPLVVKLLEGTQGIGVVLCETSQAATSVIEAFRSLDVNILVQEFIAEAAGSDIRCFVVGQRVVASMIRRGAEGDFRSNIHRGGTAEKIKITPEERSTAVRAARTMGLNVAGVDILRSNHGPVVMEVNSSPGLEGIETATEVDVAGKIMEFLEKNARPGKTRDRGKG